MLTSKLKWLQICLLATSFCIAQVASANVGGAVIFKTGDVSITHADNSVAQAEKNAALNSGDTLETREGRVQFSLIDGGKVSLQPNSIFKINKYEFSGKEDGSEFAFTELIKGGLRTISGLIGHKHRERYQLKTTVATIGIRGTEFTVNFNDNQFLMTTNHGSVDVCGASGNCLNAATGQSIAVDGPGGAPKYSSKAAKAAAAAPESSKAIFTANDVIANLSGIGNTGNVLFALSDLGNGVYNNTVNANTAVAANGQLLNVNFNPSLADKFEVTPVSFASYNNDGIVAWGQMNAGSYSLTIANQPQDINDTLQILDYITGVSPNLGSLATLSGRYNVFGFTTPFLVVAGSSTSLVGGSKPVTGYLDFDFTKLSHSYQLVVPTSIDTYTLSGSGSLVAGSPTFSSTGTATASCGCVSGGALVGGNLVQGAFFGVNGERVGLQYGFNVSGSGIPGPGGTIFGDVVLK